MAGGGRRAFLVVSYKARLKQHTAALTPHFTATPKSNVDKTLSYGQRDGVEHNILFTSPGSFPCSFDLSLLARMRTGVTGIDDL